MDLRELADALSVPFKGPADYPIAGVKDIEALSPEQGLEDGFVYFIESPAVLKRHPKAAESGVVLTTAALAGSFPRALVAPERGARPTFIALLKRFDRGPAFPPGVSSEARVHPSARVDPSA